MVIREYGECNTCNEKYLLRAGVGIELYQLHYFDCKGCDLPIVIGLRSHAPSAHFEAEENISLCEKGDNYTVINLHPNFAFTLDNYHDEKAFPAIEYNEKIRPYLRFIEGRKIQDTAIQFDIPNVVNLWGVTKNVLSLECKPEKEKNLNKMIDLYASHRKKYFSDVSISTPDEVIFNFFDSLFYPRVNTLLDPVLLELDALKEEFPDELLEYKTFFKKSIKKEQYIRYTSIFCDFFSAHSQFSQMMIHARINNDFVDDRIIGSKHFESVKFYYGQAYETLTSSFVTLAALNNIKSGRKFDEFKSMNMTKYLKDVEKSKRAGPFLDVPEFNVFTTGLDSTLRNGSHHASIWKDGENIYYRSGGTGAERDMSFSRYLHMCNQLTISIAALWLLDRKIDEA